MLKRLTKSESTAISNALQVYQNDRTTNIESLMKEMQFSEKSKSINWLKAEKILEMPDLLSAFQLTVNP